LGCYYQATHNATLRNPDPLGNGFDETGRLNMGTHIKTTIEIADELLTRARQLAHKEKRTLRELVEEGLDLALLRRADPPARKVNLPTSGGDGLRPEFQGAGWEKFRDEIYPVPGA
jgi:hypothetical protein